MTVQIVDNFMVSSKEYHKQLSWDDGQLYCTMLNEIYDDWRMPTVREVKLMFKNGIILSDCWTDDTYKSIAMYMNVNGTLIWQVRELDYWVIPVRTL